MEFFPLLLILYIGEGLWALKQNHSQHKMNPQLYSQKIPSSFIYSLNESEFRDMFLSSYQLSKEHGYFDLASLPHDYPDRWDWREKGVLSAVRNQKSCGGCWAFSTVETLESAISLTYNQSAPVLSVQEVLDCSYDNHGCKGGSTCSALKWLNSSSVPVVPENIYPTKDDKEICTIGKLPPHGALVQNFTCKPNIRTEEDVIRLIYNYGPLIAGVDANTWNEYIGGIIQYHCGSLINHAVQIVGYDLTGDTPYYIVRNSWGADWGHDGYVYIRLGADVCGITQDINVITSAKLVN